MSREPRAFVVLGFSSTHDALDAEQFLLDLGITVVPVPAPKELGTLCGIALRIEVDDEERATGYLAAAGISVTARIEIEDV